MKKFRTLDEFILDYMKTVEETTEKEKIIKPCIWIALAWMNYWEIDGMPLPWQFTSFAENDPALLHEVLKGIKLLKASAEL